MPDPFVTPSICHGGEELHELHVRYCVPLAEQLADTRTLTRDQLSALLTEAFSQAWENADQHGMDPDDAQRDAIRGVLEGLFTDLPCPRCDGEGRIAVDRDGTPTQDGVPWSAWENLPVKSALAVVTGMVRPAPCPDCAGTGQVTR